MKKTFVLLAGTCLLALSSGAASAATCSAGSVSEYTSAGFSCSVGNVLFSNIAVNALRTGSGSVTLGNFTPFSIGDEFGLSLNFSAFTGTTGGTTDVAWTYNVSALPGFLLSDVFVSLSGVTSGDAAITVNETLSNGVSISLLGPGSATRVFTPIGALGVIKDQFNFAAPGSFAQTSVLQNGFSVTAVPGPIAGAGLPALMALGGFVWARRRKVAGAALPA